MILRFFDLFSTKPTLLSSKAWMLIAVGACSITPAFAEEITVKEEADPFSGVVSLSYRSSTISQKDQLYRTYLTAGLNLEYDFPKIVTVGLSIRGNHDLINEKTNSLTSTTLSFSKSWAPSDSVGLGASVYYGAPVSKDLIKYSDSQGTVGVDGSASYKFDGSLEGLSLSAGLGYERYLYRYSTSEGGSFLDKYSYAPSVGVSYRYDKVTGSVSYTNYTSYDFDGNQQNDTFLLTETVQYRHDDKWSFNAGHTNDGYTFDYGGTANNIRLYDKRRSIVFVGASYGF